MIAPSSVSVCTKRKLGFRLWWKKAWRSLSFYTITNLKQVQSLIDVAVEKSNITATTSKYCIWKSWHSKLCYLTKNISPILSINSPSLLILCANCQIWIVLLCLCIPLRVCFLLSCWTTTDFFILLSIQWFFFSDIGVFQVFSHTHFIGLQACSFET